MFLKTISLDAMFYCISWSAHIRHPAKVFKTPAVLYINIIISLFGRKEEVLLNLN